MSETNNIRRNIDTRKNADVLNNSDARKTFAPAERKLSPLRKEVKVLYKDEDVLVLHKPAGMLSQKAVREDDSLNDYLIDLCLKEGWLDEKALRYFRPSVANRLDRNTSGIVLCGISIPGLQLLSETLRDRTIAKYYMALVRGEMKGNRRIRGYLTKDHEKNVVHFSQQKSPDAAPIETEYEVIRSGKDASLVRIRLITGKSHQIRAHLAAIGYPILGDYKYGDRRSNQRIKEALGITYQMLHSYEINFGKHLQGKVIRDELPKDFLKTMHYFGLTEEKEG